MKLKKNRAKKNIVSELINNGMLLLSFIWMVPLFFIVTNSFKTMGEVLTEPLKMPTSLSFENYITVWEQVEYPRLFINSLIVLIITELLLVLFCSMCGFWLQRNTTKKSSKYLSGYFLLSMFIPFQAIMISLIAVFSKANLTQNFSGLIISNIGLSTSMAVFLYLGYSKQIPKELDEAASVDGAGSFQIFFRIIFPLMAPMTSTVIILTSLSTWNDFLKPLLLIADKEYLTLPVGTAQVVFGQYFTRYNLAVTALVMSAAPMILAFVILQRKIISGIVSGSVKG